jgi:hypothetical protein
MLLLFFRIKILLYNTDTFGRFSKENGRGLGFFFSFRIKVSSYNKEVH